MSMLEQLLSPVMLRVMGFTLLHSLWQGTLVGVVAALLLMLLHRHVAVVRYRVAASALLGFLILVGLTFGRYYTAGLTSKSPGATESQLAVAAIAPAASGVAVAAPPTRLARLLYSGVAYVEGNLPLLVGAWLLGMVAMLLRFLGGLAYVQRLRHYRVAALPPAWQTWLDDLGRRAGLTQRVQLLASALVPSPVVVGFFRPVVLLPLSLASGLPTPALEMILAHELAHVLRRDYLFNLLQSVAEILFFYHPAVWFLSASLRTERENCCDDVATQLHGDSRLLAQALAAVAELHYAATRPSPRLAMAAVGPDGSLLGRVRRLVQHAPAVPTFAEGFGAAIVVMVGAGLLVSSTMVSLSAATVPVAASVDSAKVTANEPQPIAALVVPAPLPEPASPQLAAPVSGAAIATNQQRKLATLEEVFDAKMLRDGLTTSRQSVDYTLTDQVFIINGRQQPAAIAAEYRQLYETAMGRKLGPGGAFGRNMDLPSSSGSPGIPGTPGQLAAPSAVRATVQARQTAQQAALDQQAADQADAAARRAAAQAALDKQSADRADEAARRVAAQAALARQAAERTSSPDSPGRLTEVQVQHIMQELHRTGLLAPTETQVELEFQGDGLLVNGQPQPMSTAAHYRTLLHVASPTGQAKVHETITLNE